MTQWVEFGLELEMKLHFNYREIKSFTLRWNKLRTEVIRFKLAYTQPCKRTHDKLHICPLTLKWAARILVRFMSMTPELTPVVP